MGKLVNLEKEYVQNMFSIEGKVALVTGASGKPIIEELIEKFADNPQI